MVIAFNLDDAGLFRLELHRVHGAALESDLRTALRDVTSVPEGQVIAKAEQEAVRAALADLPEHYREIVVLREFEDMSYQEIAEVTQLPIGTVMSRLSRARCARRS